MVATITTTPVLSQTLPLGMVLQVPTCRQPVRLSGKLTSRSGQSQDFSRHPPSLECPFSQAPELTSHTNTDLWHD